VFYPNNIEELDQSTVYILYRTELELDKTEAERFRVVDARDRIQIYAVGKFVATQYQTEIGDDVVLDFKDDKLTLDILVEYLGRVNY
ncbi:beta-galactosidase, partial [Streptococcus suis]